MKQNCGEGHHNGVRPPGVQSSFLGVDTRKLGSQLQRLSASPTDILPMDGALHSLECLLEGSTEPPQGIGHNLTQSYVRMVITFRHTYVHQTALVWVDTLKIFRKVSHLHGFPQRDGTVLHTTSNRLHEVRLAARHDLVGGGVPQLPQ